MTCNKNKEGRSERTETVAAPQDVALSDIWMSKQVVLNSILLTCVTLMNIFLWSRWSGYIVGNNLAVCCLHYLTHSPFSWCWLWERKKSGNCLGTWRTVLRMQLPFELNHFKQKLSKDHLLTVGDITCHERSKSSLYQKERGEKKKSHNSRWDFSEA